MRFEDTSCKLDIARAEVNRNQSDSQSMQHDCENATKINDILLESQRQLVMQKDAGNNRAHELNVDMGMTDNKYM